MVLLWSGYPVGRSVLHHARRSVALRKFSTPVTSVANRTPPSPLSHRVIQTIRYIRIPVLIVSVYGLGYQQGVVDCTKEPKTLEKQLMSGVMVSAGAQGEAKIISERKRYLRQSATTHEKVADVGSQIIRSARETVQTKLNQAIDQVKENNPEITEPDALEDLLDANEQVQFWRAAHVRLDGEDRRQDPWKFVFIESPMPNAFVSEILPQRFFMTSALLEIAKTPDELGFVLGHEISHLILGHMSNANQVETALRTLEVLLLSIDPTAGFLSVGFMGMVYGLRRVASAAVSREHEREADQLGLEIAAAACFDTRHGAAVLKRLPERPDQLPLIDSHPSSRERHAKLVGLAKDGENYTKHGKCLTVSRRFRDALYSQRYAD